MFTERNHRVIGGWKLGKVIFLQWIDEMFLLQLRLFCLAVNYFFLAENEQITPYHQKGIFLGEKGNI